MSKFYRFFAPEPDQVVREKKKGMKYSSRSKRLSGINVYMTNTPIDIVSMEQVHDWYSLRWQIEILFKTWKSFFQIHHCKKIKPERLECHLYGQLIAILLCSSIMFQMRQLLLMKKKQELSEYKAIYMIKDYFLLLFQTIQKDTLKGGLLFFDYSCPAPTLKHFGQRSLIVQGKDQDRDLVLAGQGNGRCIHHCKIPR